MIYLINDATMPPTEKESRAGAGPAKRQVTLDRMATNPD